MRQALAALVATSALLSACHGHGDADNGSSVTRSYQVGNFQKIEVAGPYDVEVRTGSNPSVSGQGSERLLEHTKVEVKDGELVIRNEEHHSWFNFGWSHHRHKVTFIVTVPELHAASLAGSGGISVDRVAGQSFEGSVTGSGGLQLGSTDVQTLKLSIEGSGGIKAGNGKAKSVDYGTTGSGSISAASISAEQAKISIAGSGNVTANASGTADIDIMGSGNVNVTGGAKCNVNKAGSGNAQCS